MMVAGCQVYIDQPTVEETVKIRDRVKASVGRNVIVSLHGGAYLFESPPSHIDKDRFCSFFDKDQIYYLVNVGMQWLQGDSMWTWFQSLAGLSSARWHVLDLAVRYTAETTEEVFCAFGLTDYGRALHLNITEHVCFPWRKWVVGWLKFRDNGNSKRTKVARGMLRLMTGSDLAPGLNLQVYNVLGLSVVKSVLYASEAYLARKYKSTKLFALMQRMYAHVANGRNEGCKLAEILKAIDGYRSFLEFVAEVCSY